MLIEGGGLNLAYHNPVRTVSHTQLWSTPERPTKKGWLEPAN